MINLLSRVFDRFAGRGDYAVTIPVMDGPLLPNTDLDLAATVIEASAPDNIVWTEAGIVFSSGSKLLLLNEGTAELLADYSQTITAVAAGPRNQIAVALDTGTIRLRGPKGEERVSAALAAHSLHAPVAMLFIGPDDLLVADASSFNRATAWQRDLMEMRRGGSVVRYDLKGGRASVLATGLRFPAGLCMRPESPDTVIVAEAGLHRLLALPLDGSGKAKTVIADLPGYPFRLSPSADGGLFITVIAPRNQLIEFVLREPKFRKRMLSEISDPDRWVGPALSSGRSFLEPLQGGGVKQLGILKPWAPSRSYGLVVKLDANLTPVSSHHSRADGKTHGITSCVEHDAVLYATSKGGHRVVALTDRREEQRHV